MALIQLIGAGPPDPSKLINGRAHCNAISPWSDQGFNAGHDDVGIQALANRLRSLGIRPGFLIAAQDRTTCTDADENRKLPSTRRSA